MPAKKTKKKTTTKTAPAKPAPPIGRVAAFTLDDVKSLLKTKKTEASVKNKKPAKKAAKKKEEVAIEDIPHEAKSYGAASLTDILGYNPDGNSKSKTKDKIVPRKFKVYYDLLVSLRDHLNKEDSGDIASYNQPTADEETDNFDREFALSLVSSEQEALSEIEEAIGRIDDGSYGVCEITGNPISEERLKAVPFTRHSLEGQKQLEKNKRFSIQSGGAYSTGIEDFTQFIASDDAD